MPHLPSKRRRKVYSVHVYPTRLPHARVPFRRSQPNGGNEYRSLIDPGPNIDGTSRVPDQRCDSRSLRSEQQPNTWLECCPDFRLGGRAGGRAHGKSSGGAQAFSQELRRWLSRAEEAGDSWRFRTYNALRLLGMAADQEDVLYPRRNPGLGRVTLGGTACTGMLGDLLMEMRRAYRRVLTRNTLKSL